MTAAADLSKGPARAHALAAAFWAKPLALQRGAQRQRFRAESDLAHVPGVPGVALAGAWLSQVSTASNNCINYSD